MWSEEELRDIPDTAPEEESPAPPEVRPRSRAGSLRWSLAQSNAETTYAHERTRSSVVYTPTATTHGNFIDAAYKRIQANPLWSARLTKAHSGKSKARPQGSDEITHVWRELDTATSSDALLMNIFCYPRVLATPRLPALLGIPTGLQPEFGYYPRLPCAGRLPDRTEVDMHLGPLLVEAKLTEADFQHAPPRLVERYLHFEEVFDPALLPRNGSGFHSYQLLRGVLAAHYEHCRFAVFLDARRPDLLESWFAVMRAVRSYELRARLRLLTWQELAAALPRPLRDFLSDKYGIHDETKAGA